MDHRPADEVKELRLLLEMNLLFDGLQPVRSRLGEALELMARHTGLIRGAVALAEPDGEEIRLAAALGLSEEELERGRYRPGEGVTGRVVASGRPMAASNLAREPLFLNRTGARDLAKEKISFICVPLKVRGRPVGALSADRLFADSVPLEEDLRLLTEAAGLVGRALEIERELAARRLKDEPPAGQGTGRTDGRRPTLPEALDDLERRLITEALAEHQGHMSRAAEALGVSERVMGLRMRKFGLNFKQFRRAIHAGNSN